MKIFAWLLILLGVGIVILKGIDYKKNHQSDSDDMVLEQEPIGWETYAGGAIAIIGTFMLANCERKRNQHN